MNDQELLNKAQELYKKKKYADAVRTTMQLMEKGNYEQQVMILSAKALIGTTVTDSGNDLVWQNIFSAVSSIMDDMHTYEQYQQVRYEILEAVAEAEREFHKSLLKKLEGNPTFEQFQSNNTKSFMHSIFSIKISATMSQHPQIEALRGKKKEEDNEDNAFADDEKYRMNYDAGMRIFDKAKARFESVQNCDVNATATAILVADLLWAEATKKLEKEPLELRVMRLEKNLVMVQYLLKLHRDYNVLSYSGVSEKKAELAEINKDLKKVNAALKKQKEKEEKARVAAYWAAHPEEKANLQKELKEQETLRKELSAVVDSLHKQSAKLQEKLKKGLPAETARDQQKSIVRNLETELNACWFFQVKKKRELTERLDTVERPKMVELEQKAKNERAELDESLNTQLSKLRRDLAPKVEELQGIKNRIAKIEKQLANPK